LTPKTKKSSIVYCQYEAQLMHTDVTFKPSNFLLVDSTWPTWTHDENCVQNSLFLREIHDFY